jgi:hypothetical protein
MSMELTTRCLEPGHHRVYADGRPTVIYLNRSTGSGKEYGWWIDDDRLDYRDRRGTLYPTMSAALDWLENCLRLASEWRSQANLLGLEEEVGS